MPDHDRLIQHAFPLKQSSLGSVHVKNVRHGHISTSPKGDPINHLVDNTQCYIVLGSLNDRMEKLFQQNEAGRGK
jgi:hypothetical protein